MNARLFKAPDSFDEFIEFFGGKFQIAEQVEEEFLAGKNYRYFEVDNSGTTFLLAEYSLGDSIRDFEKEITNISDYGLLVRGDLEEYIFLKYNEGTGKIERLKKKTDGLEIAFIKKLDKLSFGDIETLDKIFDRSEFVREFYDLFCDTEEFLRKKIYGIPEPEDLNLYVKILLNRLMFLWFLQKKGLLDGGDEDYLLTKFKEIGADKDKGGVEFFGFLNTLFFQGLCVKTSERRKEVAELIGDIPFLNGGLFIESEVEQKYQNISVPNDAFHRPMTYPITKGEKNIPALNLMESKEWTIDERSGDVNQISPEILGYIFEKSVNQKGLGAFYTPEEITTYIARNTVHPYLLDRVKETTGNSFDSMGELLKTTDKKTLKTLYNELRDIKILDPAVGSGHFLVDSMQILQRIYESLRDKGVHDWNSYQIRDHIIKNNLYGVDILPGGVEICKLRMFLALAETFTSILEIQPLPNIDFNFRVGNSLIGYTDIKKVNQENLALSGGVINKMSAVLGFIKRRYPEQLLLMRTLNEKLQKLEVLKPREMFDVRTKLVKLYTSEHDRERATKLRNLLDELTAAFNKELNRLLYGEFRKRAKKLTLQDLGKDKLKAFHWAMEFSEVFEKGGFCVTLGNPPWDIVKPSEKEFFSQYDSRLTKYGVDKREARRIIDKLLEDEDIESEWNEHKRIIKVQADYFKTSNRYEHQSDIINGKRVGGDLNLYKLFLEQFYKLAKDIGYVGVVIPSGLYTDAGTKGLRKMVFDTAEVSGLYCFENRKGIFEGIHRSFKFIVLTFGRGRPTKEFRAAFMQRKSTILKDPDKVSVTIDWELIKKLSPTSYSVIEFKSERDVEIVKKLYKFPILGESIEGTWDLSLTNEFHMTNDSPLFNTEPNGLVLYEGKMIEQFTHTFDKPRYWVEEERGVAKVGNKDYKEYRLGFRDIASSTNRRSLITTILPKNVFCGNTLVLSRIFRDGIRFINEKELVFVCALFNSFVLDYLIRLKITSHLSMFFIYELPVPRLTEGGKDFDEIVELAGKLICTTPEFNELKGTLGIDSGIHEKDERVRTQAALDILVSKLYGITPEELEYIIGQFDVKNPEAKEELDKLKGAVLDAIKGGQL